MSGRLLLDEMYPPALAEVLCQGGHDAMAVAASSELAGTPDSVVLAAAADAQRCLVTENVRDFAVLVAHDRHGGVVFVNARRWPRTPGGIKRLAEALDQMISGDLVPRPGEVRWLT